MYKAIILLGLLASSSEQTAASSDCTAGETLIRGQVREAGAGALAGATIAVRGGQAVAVSQADGSFGLCATPGPTQVLVATRRGYQALEVELAGSYPEEPLHEIRLEMQRVGYFEAIDVQARRAMPEQEPIEDSMQLTALDVLRTAGSQGDVFRRAQMLPGVSKVDEGAGLFVRGGDIEETATYLDRAQLSHPYRLETPNGGFFGTVPPWLIAGLSLSTGGFPARYGNALSGVLELEGLERPEHRELILNAGLAAFSAQLSVPLNEKAGIRLSGNRSQTRTLFEVNSVDQQYSNYPAASDLNIGLYFETDHHGRFEAIAFDQHNEVGLGIELESFQGLLSSEDDNRGFAASWQRAWGACCTSTLTLSHGDYRQRSAFGVLDLTERDRSDRLRFDLEAPAGAWTLHSGVEWEQHQLRFTGDAPRSGGDFDGLEGTRQWQLDFSGHRAGVYLELERVWERFEANFGIRADFHSPSGTAVDPRLAIIWSPRPDHRLRLAAGVYSQAPQAQFLDPDFGNPDLPVMQAQHLILGYTYRQPDDPLHLRLEVYTKDYDDLPLESEASRFSGEGSGWARGADLLITAKRGRWSGWMSAGTVTSRRRATRWFDAGRLPVPDRPVASTLATPHNLQLSSEWLLPGGVSLGASFRWSAGRPFTPIVGAEEVSSEDGTTDYLPVYGQLVSENYPDFRRLNLVTSKSLPFLDTGIAVLYLGISNVFDRQSTFRYTYSADYSQRRPVQTSFGRTFYTGITLNL